MRLLETIKIENRTAKNLAFHQFRMNQARYHLLGITRKINLFEELQIPEDLNDAVYKCRIIYDSEIHQIEFILYQPKTVQSLKIVHADDVEYSFKYENRLQLQASAQQKGKCDDVLIVKNNFITDTSYANIVFWNGVEWVTPEKPLLEGTQRALLLHQKQIVSRPIHVSELPNYQYCRIINALLEFDAPAFPIENIQSL